ncbi:hypothetical protein BC940DRAFT_305528 [Gongronella butleri]|nr:hypothetical protein BC940DRAFT_305528 [Gongronella butleri]
MKRTKPCDNCRRRRRKCQATDKKECVRCERLGIVCSFNPALLLAQQALKEEIEEEDEEDVMAEVDGDDELNELYQHVVDLEQEMHELHQEHQAMRRVAKTRTQWQLSIVNGQIRLETGIHTLTQLLALLQEPRSVRYLSPFDQSSVPFQLAANKSFLRLVTGQLAQRGLYNETAHTFNDAQPPPFAPWPAITSGAVADPFADINIRDTHGPSITAESSPAEIIHKLVHQYFHCYNVVLPLLHRETFMAYFEKCQERAKDELDPLAAHGPVTLALCAYMSITCCRHLHMGLHDRRSLAESFYIQCQDRLYDILDDPAHCKQLEAMITINMLLKFLFMTLRLKEARKLISIAVLLATELRKAQSRLSHVEKVIAQRHAIYANVFFGIIEYFCSRRMDDIPGSDVPLEVLPDECPTTQKCLVSYQYFCKLVLHPVFKQMVKHARRIVVGELVQIDVDIIVGFESWYDQWWQQLPSNLKYCDNPFDVSIKSRLLLVDCPVKLMLHAGLLSVCCGLYTMLAFPRNCNSTTSAVIQGKSRQMALKCCDLLLAIDSCVRRISPYCGFSSEYLIRVYDSLCVLSDMPTAGDQDFNGQIKAFIQECFTRLTPQITTNQVLTADNNYHNAPLPAYHLILDIVTQAAQNAGIV